MFSAKLRRGGIMGGLTKEGFHEEVSTLNLKRVQLNKLFVALSSL